MTKILLLLLILPNLIFAYDKALVCNMDYEKNHKLGKDYEENWKFTIVFKNNEASVVETKHAENIWEFKGCEIDEVTISCLAKDTNTESPRFHHKTIMKINRISGEIYLNSNFLPYKDAKSGNSRLIPEQRWSSAQVGVCSDARQKF